MMDAELHHDVDPLAAAAVLLRADSSRVDSDVTPLKLHKLLYIAQANFLASTGRRLLAANVEAFKHGPVIDAILPRFSGKEIIDLNVHPNVAQLTVPDDVDAFLKQVWSRFGEMSASQLYDYTHKQKPWLEHYYPDAFHERIPDEELAAYFRDEVPINERIFHPDVVVVSGDLLDRLDEDEDAMFAKALAAFRS